MLSDLFNSPAVSMLERTLNFTEARHQVILENIANVSTPGYVQKDASVAEFQQSLQAAVDRQQQSFNTAFEPSSTDTVEFTPGSNDVQLKPKDVVTSTPFHDRGIRSMESLMGDLLDNAQVHNMAAQFLKAKYTQLTSAIQMRV
jgi:flagellar basal-body rod protein FlgB